MGRSTHLNNDRSSSRVSARRSNRREHEQNGILIVAGVPYVSDRGVFSHTFRGGGDSTPFLLHLSENYKYDFLKRLKQKKSIIGRLVNS